MIEDEIEEDPHPEHELAPEDDAVIGVWFRRSSEVVEGLAVDQLHRVEQGG